MYNMKIWYDIEIVYMLCLLRVWTRKNIYTYIIYLYKLYMYVYADIW